MVIVINAAAVGAPALQLSFIVKPFFFVVFVKNYWCTSPAFVVFEKDLGVGGK